MPEQLFADARTSLQSRIIGRARCDPDYRERLLRDPAAAVSEQLGVPLPPGMSVTVVEERTDHLCVVLPVDASGVGADAMIAMTGLARGDGTPRAG